MRDIYRGYEIEQTELGCDVYKDGKLVQSCKDEDAAYHWVNGEKAVEHKQ